MALVTTLSHFQQPTVKLPDDETNAFLSATIAVGEAEMLKALFGYQMYKDFVFGIDWQVDKWVDMAAGGEYTHTDGLLRKWEGFTSGKNPVALYIYFKYLSNVRQSATNSGIKVVRNENMETGNTRFNQVNAWNEMVKINWELHWYLVANESEFPDYIGLEHSPDSRLRYGITDNQNLFIPINQFGL